MLVLALDISTKAGWALLEKLDDGSIVLRGSGVVKNPTKIKEYDDYPYSYRKAAHHMATKLKEVVSAHRPDAIVIEETNKSRARYTQKILEFIHYAFLCEMDYLSAPPIAYISTSVWRRNLGLTLSKEDKKNNSKINNAKHSGKSKKELGLKGKITPKHLAVAFANERFGLSLKVKDNDIADAICQGLAYLNGAELCDGE